MKIGILCTMINGFGRKGFYNIQEIGLGRALARKGHEVKVYKCIKKKRGMRPEKAEAEPGLTVYYLPIGGLGAHGYLRSNVISKELDGLLCFADNQVLLPHIYRFCMKNGICFVPYVGTTFSLHSGLHAKVMDTWFHMGTLKIFKRNTVIAKTETAKRELEALGVDDITIAPVGLDIMVLKSDFRSYDRDRLREVYGYDRDDVVICSVARLEPEKRPLELLEMLYRMKDRKRFRLLLVGEGILRQDVDRKIEEYGMENEVKIFDRVPYGEMWKIYTASDYFVNMNRSEIFGMAVMEAVYYETSVAAIKAPGPSITLDGMEGHCLCRDDQEIEQWLTGKYPPEEVLTESAEKMEKKFSWNRCADTFIAIVERDKRERSEKQKSRRKKDGRKWNV